MCDKAELASVQENCTVKVSVVIPIYNAYDYLRPAMDSVLDQTLSDIEVICVDDGSTDHSLDILREYQKADARVRIITETNAGPGLARNAGFRRARGEYVIFLDADDFFEPTLLEKMYLAATSQQLDIAIVRYDIYSSKDAAFRKNTESEHLMRIFGGGAVSSKNEHPDTILESTTGSAWNKMLKRSFIMEKGLHFLQDVMMFEDVFFTVTALAFAERVALVPEVLVHHRVYNDQSRAKHFKIYYRQVPEVYLHIKDFLMKGGMYEPLSRGFLSLTAGRCHAVYCLLPASEREIFWNMLHGEYCERLGWQGRMHEDFSSEHLRDFVANVELYTYEQYQRRRERGECLDTDRIDQTLQHNQRRKMIADFFKKTFSKKKER